MIDVTGLLIGLVFGSVGVGYCIYGKKQKKTVAFWIGVALIVLPYVIDSNIAVAIVSVALMCVPLYVK